MSRRRQSVNIIPVSGSSGQQQQQQHHPAYDNSDLHDSAPSLNYNHQHEKRGSSNGGSQGHAGNHHHHRRISSGAGGSAGRHSSLNMMGGGSPDRSGSGGRKQAAAAVGRRHSTAIDPRAAAEAAARREREIASNTSNRHSSMPRISSSDRIHVHVPGVDSSNHSRDRGRDRDRERVRRSQSEKDQLPSKYNRFDEAGLEGMSDSHGSDSFGSPHSSGNLRKNRSATTSKQIKANRSRDLQCLAALGLELQEELQEGSGEFSGGGGSDVAKVEPSTRSTKKTGNGGEAGLSTNSGRSLDIDLDSVEAKAIIKLQKQLKNAQAEILHSHQKSSDLSLDNAERGVQIHELTHQVKELLALTEQAKVIRAENETLQRKMKRGSGESESIRQDNDMLRREIDMLRVDNLRLAEQKSEMKNEVGYLRKERESASGEIDKLRMEKNEMKKELGYLRKDREAMKDKVGRLSGKLQKLEGENQSLVNELAKTRNMLEKTDRALRAQEDLVAAKAATLSSSAKHYRSNNTRAPLRVAHPPPPSASDGVVTASLAPRLNDDLLRRNGRRPMS